MKKIITIAGLIVTMVVALTCFTSLAMAESGDIDVWLVGPAHVSGNGNTIWISTEDQFSPTDVTKIEIFYIIGPDEYLAAAPKNLVLNDNKIGLVFDKQDIPDAVDTTRIEITVSVGTVYGMSGPGWALGRGR